MRNEIIIMMFLIYIKKVINKIQVYIIIRLDYYNSKKVIKNIKIYKDNNKVI